jgi:hypothetical protein
LYLLLQNRALFPSECFAKHLTKFLSFLKLITLVQCDRDRRHLNKWPNTNFLLNHSEQRFPHCDPKVADGM